MSDALRQLLAFLSVALGPFASDKVPALAPDLRPWAFWLSGIASLAAALLFTARLSGKRIRPVAWVYLKRSGALSLALAMGYFVVNLLWSRESGGWMDLVGQVAIVVIYSLTFASLTAAAVAAEKYAKRDGR